MLAIADRDIRPDVRLAKSVCVQRGSFAARAAAIRSPTAA